MDKSIGIESEAFYHFVWQHKLFETRQLKTMCGLPIEVIHTGLLNTNAGPDFFNAKIKIDGVLWAGNVEIHTRSSEWQHHGHQHDSSYDNVILHIVAHYDTPTANSQGRSIPCVEINPLHYVFENYKTLYEEKQNIACATHLSHLDPLFWVNYKDRLATERLEQKSQHIASIIEHNHGDWEDVFFNVLCRSLGSGINSDTFERLGKSLSYKIIAKHRDHLVQLEALLFGQAGFLEESREDTYHTLLRKEYAFLKNKYQLTPLEKHLWKFLRLRPNNFPTIRLAQLAQLLHQHHSLLHMVVDTPNLKLPSLFKVQVSNYWLTHYQFGKLSDQRPKTLGKNAINTILINAVSPLLFSYGRITAKNKLCDKALEILDKLPAENNHIIKRWHDYGIKSESAFDSQALLQLYNNYCLNRKCIHCNIGHHYVSLQH